MKHTLTIMKRELGGYFATPVAYVFIVIFLVLSGFLTFLQGGLYESGQASLGRFFTWHPWLYLFLIPALLGGGKVFFVGNALVVRDRGPRPLHLHDPRRALAPRQRRLPQRELRRPARRDCRGLAGSADRDPGGWQTDRATDPLIDLWPAIRPAQRRWFRI